MNVIIVSGTPGTGKTTYAKQYAKDKGYKYIDVNKIIETSEVTSGFDRKRESKIIDTEKLNSVLIEIINSEKMRGKKKGLVIDSHLTHYLPKEVVNKCIITKCSLPRLKQRLEDRGYSRAKVRENLDAEIFDVCNIEAQEAGHKIKIIFTG